jgi:hypothetical protein
MEFTEFMEFMEFIPPMVFIDGTEFIEFMEFIDAYIVDEANTPGNPYAPWFIF